MVKKSNHMLPPGLNALSLMHVLLPSD